MSIWPWCARGWQEGFESQDQDRLARLMPHLQKALRVQQQLRNMDSAAHALQAAATGSLLLDDQLRLVAASPGVAEALSVRIGSLGFGGSAGRRTDERLDQALRATLRDGAMRHLELGPDQGLPERVWLTLTRRHPDADGGGARQLLVLVQWPERRHQLQPEVLVQLFRPHAARSRDRACALVEGKTPRQIWTEHGVLGRYRADPTRIAVHQDRHYWTDGFRAPGNSTGEGPRLGARRVPGNRPATRRRGWVAGPVGWPAGGGPSALPCCGRPGCSRCRMNGSPP